MKPQTMKEVCVFLFVNASQSGVALRFPPQSTMPVKANCRHTTSPLTSSSTTSIRDIVFRVWDHTSCMSGASDQALERPNNNLRIPRMETNVG